MANKRVAGTTRARSPRSSRPAAGLFALLALTHLPATQAIDWQFRPELLGSVTYSDNANQHATNPDDAMIFSVMPGFTLQSEGSSRVEALLQYGMRGVLRVGDNRNDSIQHNLNGTGKAELVEDFLFVDANARVSQELISLLGSPASAEVNDSNRATVSSYSISPYITKRLGTTADVLARYTASAATFGESDVSDSSSNAFTASVNSGTRFNDLSWSLVYSIRDAVNRKDVDTRFEQASARVGYELSRKVQVFAIVGQDWNEYPSLTATEGRFYRGGFGWSPTRRTSIEASGGDSYFGNTYNVAARHRTRMTNWSLSYDEAVSDSSQFIPENGIQYDFLCPDAEGHLTVEKPDWQFKFPPGPGCVAVGGDEGPVYDIRSGVFIAKTLRSGMSWRLRKFTYFLNYSDLRRFYTASNEEDHTRSLNALVTYAMSPVTTLNAGVTLSRLQIPQDLPLIDRDDDLVVVSVGLDHRFAESLDGALVFRRTERDSNVASADYTENSVTASVNMRF